MNKKLILLSTLITHMILTNYSYGEEVTDEDGYKVYWDKALITTNKESGIMKKSGTAMGYNATANADNSVVLGTNAIVHKDKGTAVGVRALVLGAQGSTALGSDSYANRTEHDITEALSNHKINFNGEVSLGSDLILRQITHVAGGTEDTDAVNLRQLRSLNDKINGIKTEFSDKDKVDNAKTALENTRQHEMAANTHQENAKTTLEHTRQHETAANTHQENAKKALENTRQHETAANTHQKNAKTALENTRQHETAANTHQKNAKTALEHTRQHETAANTHQENAKTALEHTHQHKTAANTHQENAKTALEHTRQHETAANTHQKNAKTALDNTRQHETAANTHQENAKTALENIQHYEADSKTAVESTQHSAQSTHVSARQVQALVGQLETEVAYIGRMAKQTPDGAIHIGHNLAGSTISVRGQEGDRILTDVADGVRDHDAANISQLNNVHRMMTAATEELAYKNALRMDEMQYELSKTNKKIARGLASSAALSGLFQPYNVGKINITAGFGRYDTTTAIAVGTGYRFNTHAAVKAGFAYSGENNFTYNASFNLEW